MAYAIVSDPGQAEWSGGLSLGAGGMANLKSVAFGVLEPKI